MDKKAIKIYVTSNVGIDFFFFLCKTIKNAGYDVHPLFLISELRYRKFAKATGLKKIWLRIQMYILFTLYLIYKGLISKKNSIFVITSNPFYAPYLMKLIVKARNGKVIHMLYDLFPDAIEVAGLIKVNSFGSKVIGKFVKLNQQKCDATVYLGDFLKIHAENRWGKAQKSKIIDICTDLSLYTLNHSENFNKKKLIIHYGGQLGHLHDAASIIESVKYTLDSDISEFVEFNFYVSGAQAQLLETSLTDYPVKIISTVPGSQWRRDILNYNIGLVSLLPGAATVCLPSKTYAMIAGGLSIVGICPEWSDLSGLIKGLKAGWVVNNSYFNNKEDIYEGQYLRNISKKRDTDKIVEDFYEVIKFILNNKGILNEKRKNAFYRLRDNYNINTLSDKWEEVIQNI